MKEKIKNLVEKFNAYFKENEKTILSWFFVGLLVGGFLTKLFC